MKQAEIVIGKDYAYQSRKNGESASDIERATIKGFTHSFGGAPMVEIDIKRHRWEHEYTADWKRIEGSQHRVDYIDSRKVTLSTIRGDWDTEHSKRVEADAIRLESARKADEAYKIRQEEKRTTYDPALREMLQEIVKIEGKGYISGWDRLETLTLKQVTAITEALRKASN
jgi:hypothetical protein